MSYTYNKAPKDRELLKTIRRSIVKDIRRNGFTMEDFAHEIGLSEGTLENKLKPAMATSDITLSEFIHIMDLTADYSPLEYITKRYGFTLCKPKIASQTANDPIINVVIHSLNLEEAQGDLAKAIKEAIKDGVLDEDEKKEIKDLAYELRKLAVSLEESVSQSPSRRVND